VGHHARRMSRARLVITAVTVEKRPVSEVARSYGVARSWIYTLLALWVPETVSSHVTCAYSRSGPPIRPGLPA
jgi:hypothetical protein